MGGGKSKERHPSAPKHSTLPVDQVPYQGPMQQYAFLHVNVKVKTHFTFSFAPGQNVVTSNVDEYYPQLADLYKDGYRLLQFLKVPLALSQGGFLAMSANFPYQAVFCRKVLEQPEPNSWQLKIEKSMIYMHQLGGGILFSIRQEFAPSTSDLSHMYEIIQRNASVGGRFVCMEQTGMVQSQGMNMAMSGVSPGIGTDLFFNMPLHPNPVLYTYTAISVPVPLKYTYGIGGSIDMVIDWMGNLAQHLNQGWRLADIYMDDIQQLHAQRDRDGHDTFVPVPSVNSVWFFEKELSKLDDPTPLYEGTILEYHVKAKAGLASVSSDFDISKLCQEMGHRGWKLTCFLQTPKIVNSGFMSVTVATLMFFQRKIMGPPAPPPGFGIGMPVEGATGYQQPPPPSYESATVQKG